MSVVPAQMRQAWVQSWCRCGRSVARLLQRAGQRLGSERMATQVCVLRLDLMQLIL